MNHDIRTIRSIVNSKRTDITPQLPDAYSFAISLVSLSIIPKSVVSA